MMMLSLCTSLVSNEAWDSDDSGGVCYVDVQGMGGSVCVCDGLDSAV